MLKRIVGELLCFLGFHDYSLPVDRDCNEGHYDEERWKERSCLRKGCHKIDYIHDFE